MTTGISALGKSLIGVEATAGGSTDIATTHWRGMGRIADRREMVYPPEKVGKIGNTTRSYVPRTGGEVLLESDATFEQLPYIFNAGFYTATPTTDASSAQIRAWSVQSSSSDPIATTDLSTLVVESGDNVQAEVARFCFVRQFSLTGRQGEGVQFSGTLQSRAPETGTFTAVSATDLENPAETILFSKSYLYIDPSTDTAGTTLKSETLMDATLNVTTGWVEINAKDGRTDFSNIKRVDDEITLEVAFEHNSVAVAEKAAFRAQTERVLRLKFLGNALSTTDAGATYDTKALVIDLYGKWTSFGVEGLEEQDGDNLYRGTFRAAWSAAAANKAVITVVNELASLP